MSEPLEIDLSSTDAFVDQMLAFGDSALPAAGAVLYERFEAVMARSKDEFVPVEEGTLKASGYVLPPVIDGDEVSVTGGYGGPASAYALKQHEDDTLHHPRVGTDHYLLKPLNEEIPDLPQHLADGIGAAASRMAQA